MELSERHLLYALLASFRAIPAEGMEYNSGEMDTHSELCTMALPTLITWGADASYIDIHTVEEVIAAMECYYHCEGDPS